MAWTTPETAVAGQVLTAAYLNTNLVDNMNSLVEAGTALPSSPSDGQSFYYVADTTNGVVWHLRYRSASASAYKWEFVGGESIGGTILTSQGLGATVNTWADLATAGPSLTLPLAGDYRFRWGAYVKNDSGLGSILGIGLRFGATDPTAAPGLGIRWTAGITVASTNNPGQSVSGEDVATAQTASTIVKAVYRQNNSNCNFGNRYLYASPVRVG